MMWPVHPLPTVFGAAHTALLAWVVEQGPGAGPGQEAAGSCTVEFANDRDRREILPTPADDGAPFTQERAAAVGAVQEQLAASVPGQDVRIAVAVPVEQVDF